MMGVAIVLAGCGSGHSTTVVIERAAPSAAAPTTTPPAQSAADTDSGAEALARTAEVTIETYATDQNGSYAGATLAKLEQIEPTLSGDGAAIVSDVSATTDGYDVTTKATSTGDTFSIHSASGTITRSCTGGGACHNGAWR